ncbi:phosphotransferase enzyme family protein [Pelagibacterium mangrovi]|uniref:phosphotransferase enzyme family protein n=1 Tax=Pelagibacterium mangrovi TaxID=3119828 RepID=UPI002FC59400
MNDAWGGLATALGSWPDFAGSALELINLSENHTFRLDLPTGGRAVLRVHRPGYHSRQGIESELAWMQALRSQTGLFTPRPLPGCDGQLVQEGPFRGETRHMVAFAFEEGEEPQVGDDLAPVFHQLGSLAAQCHLHVIGWTPPAGFTRHVWTARTILDPDATWGDWRATPGVIGETRQVLDKLNGRLRELLDTYGMSRERFGLIHADMRLANLLVSDGQTRLIDFDDCGFCWFGYDFGAAVSFFEESETIPALRAAWLAGYRTHRPFSREDEAMLDVMVLLRRMALLAWIETHPEAEPAQQLRARYARESAEMAERFLSTGTIDR